MPLYRVLAAAFVGGLGEYVIVQDGSELLRLSDTATVATAGGSGPGPAEFGSIRNLVLTGDTLWATNASPPRIAAFRASDLRWLGLTESLPFTPRTIARGKEDWVVAVQGEYVFSRITARTAAIDPIVRTNGHVVDTIGLVPGRAVWGRADAYHPIPFQSVRTTAALIDGFVYWHEASSTMTIIGAMGRRTESREVLGRREKVTDAVFHNWRRSILGDRPLQSAHEVFRTMPIPEHAPLYQRTRVAASVIWAQRFPEDLAFGPEHAVMWDLFDMDLSYHGAVSLPSRFTPLAVTSTRMLGILRDSLDVGLLVEYEIFDAGPSP